MTHHQTYITKKNVAKLIMAKKEITFKEAFDSIPDEVIISTDHNAIFETLLSGKFDGTPKKDKKKK